ncbi:TetR/AcrR family transcriptional regulator [uncultured Sphingomonas sp.]|uniref:TetR/AcrR family transcriptional regulator n=1 Tax=uncultured Sphingomonas sp. TaxID=158754 RepID=UPI0035CB9EE7
MPREGLKPELVTEAAATIVDDHGLAALTLARLATDLGVAAPSLYKHIGGIEDLILRVSTLAVRRLADVLTTAALGRSGRHALVSIATAHRRFAIEHAGLYALTQTALKIDSSAQRAEISRPVAIFDAVVRSYGVPDDLSVHAMRIVRAGLHGFADIETRGGFQMSHSIDESFLFLIDALHASLQQLCKHDRQLPNA